MKAERTPQEQEMADRLKSGMLEVALVILTALAFLAWILARMAQARSHHRERRERRKALRRNPAPEPSS
jgi:flagellar biogenesis protein FliO